MAEFSSIFGISLSFPDDFASRVAGGCCQPQAPEEPCMRVSPHTARASEKSPLWGFPQALKGLLHVTMDSHDRQNSQRPAERTISPEGGRHLLSLLSSDSITFHVTRDQRNVSLLTEPGMSHPVSRPL